MILQKKNKNQTPNELTDKLLSNALASWLIISSAAEDYLELYET